MITLFLNSLTWKYSNELVQIFSLSFTTDDLQNQTNLLKNFKQITIIFLNTFMEIEYRFLNAGKSFFHFIVFIFKIEHTPLKTRCRTSQSIILALLFDLHSAILKQINVIIGISDGIDPKLVEGTSFFCIWLAGNVQFIKKYHESWGSSLGIGGWAIEKVLKLKNKYIYFYF